MAPTKTRMTNNGYKQFWDERAGRWAYVHRDVAERKLGRQLRPGEHVHHINGNKRDNRRANLTAVDERVHGRIHNVDEDACFRCGRSGHWANECYAHTYFDGDDIGDDFEGDDEETDDVDDEDDYIDDDEGDDFDDEFIDDDEDDDFDDEFD